MYKKTFPILVILVITFFLAIAYSVNNAHAQETVSKSEAAMGGVDSYDVSETNIVYNFNELSPNPNYYYNYLQYQYARFNPYPSGYFRIKNQVTATTYYPNYITNDYPYHAFGGVDVQFTQSVRNLSFTTVGVDGGNFKVDIYQNGAFTQQITISAVCGPYENCFTDLRNYQNLTRISIHSINDPLGLGFDDFSFTLGGTPTPTPTPTPTNRSPIGYLGIVREDGIATGWTLDPDNQDVSNVTHFYIDGLSSANFVGAMVASVPRPDVNQVTGYRGNHGFEFSIPERFRDGSPHTIYAYGLDLTNGQPATLLTDSPKTFTLHPVVQSVAFESITNETIDNQLTNSEIDRPAYGYPSQRIFAEAKFPGDTVNHKRVRVRARVGKPNVTVYFKNYDVDDPSDDPIIDDTGNAGDDNHKGRFVGGAYPPFARGTLSGGEPCTPGSTIPTCVKSLTDANGDAIAYFTVTDSPGDNFRVAASTDSQYLNGVQIAGTGLSDAANISLANTVKAKQTELLTVWRKVHLEVDSMGEVLGNAVNGTIPARTSVDVGYDPVWLTLFNFGQTLEEGRYRGTQRPDRKWLYGGRLSLGFGNSSLQVLENTSNAVLVRSNSGIIQIRGREQFSLFDDDDYNSDDILVNGDDREDVDFRFNYNMGYCLAGNETLSRLCPTSDVERNPYAAAYIEPEYEWARQQPGMNDTDVTFKIFIVNNTTDRGFGNQREAIDEKRDSDGMESNDFWIGHLLLGYQEDFNFDPPGPTPLGVAPPGVPYPQNNSTNSANSFNDVPVGSIGAIIYLETMRDVDVTDNQNFRIKTAPHELGHQFGITGDDSAYLPGVTTWGLMGYTDSYDLRLVPHHIKVLRFRTSSPGK